MNSAWLNQTSCSERSALFPSLIFLSELAIWPGCGAAGTSDRWSHIFCIRQLKASQVKGIPDHLAFDAHIKRRIWMKAAGKNRHVFGNLFNRLVFFSFFFLTFTFRIAVHANYKLKSKWGGKNGKGIINSKLHSNIVSGKLHHNQSFIHHLTLPYSAP